MLIAIDYNDNRVYIDNTNSNQEYFCPSCGAPLVTRKGDQRQHHFAHRPKHKCTDTWEAEHYYDMSEWHSDWQSVFPFDNQEVKIALGETNHRADVMIGKTVIEFQHSMMSSQSFDNRNNFYFNLGYKVIWLFDMRDLFESEKLTYKRSDDGTLVFSWENPKKAFNAYDIACGTIDMFFQINSDDENSIVRVLNVSPNGFNCFYATELMSKREFLEYVGYKNGTCVLPDRFDLELNERYNLFKEKYHINLNHQQERALQAIEGHNLVLAVPGSGKTTVLIAKLGYMILEKGISPDKILALTFNKCAAEEMKIRFTRQFGTEIANKVQFKTINSFSYDIYKRYCIQTHRQVRTIPNDSFLFVQMKNIYSKYFPDEYPTDNEILDLLSKIEYCKNMIYDDARLKHVNDDIPYFYGIFKEYSDLLKKTNYMDYSDQMVFADYILSNYSGTREYWSNKYEYVLVDEAQDTSKIQHKIIRTISSGNNLFMVGDEDQSIYGFRGAYPKALLNFRIDYSNPFIQRMEKNYRSTPEIVEMAHTFISKNKGRFEKNMIAERESGDGVNKIVLSERSSQYTYLLEQVSKRENETAIIYRDNSCAVPLIDLFQRNGIPFTVKENKMNFFESKIVKDIVAYFKLSLDSFDYMSFNLICNHGLIYLRSNQKQYAVNNCRYKKISIFDAIEEQMKYIPYRQRTRASNFQVDMQEIANLNSKEAIEYICDVGYSEYLREKNFDYSKIEILKRLAEQEPNKKNFLKRLAELEPLSKGCVSSDSNPVILSTSHSCKGLEFDTVYIFDIYDGQFPYDTNRTDYDEYDYSSSKDSEGSYQEERRLFYVSMTRAKNHLNIINIRNRKSSFIDDIFPPINYRGEDEYDDTDEELHEQDIDKYRDSNFRSHFLLHDQSLIDSPGEIETTLHMPALYDETPDDEEESDYYEIVEPVDTEIDEKCREEVMKKYSEEHLEQILKDSRDRQWVKCKRCNEFDFEWNFSIHQGSLGICRTCMIGKR